MEYPDTPRNGVCHALECKRQACELSVMNGLPRLRERHLSSVSNSNEHRHVRSWPRIASTKERHVPMMISCLFTCALDELLSCCFVLHTPLHTVLASTPSCPRDVCLPPHTFFAASRCIGFARSSSKWPIGVPINGR